MQASFKATVAGLALSLLGAAAVSAAQTNLVQTLSFNLSATSQGPTLTNGVNISSSVNLSRIKTDDIVQALGDATTNHFSRAARLVVVRALPDGDPVFYVRDGQQSVDVSDFFVHRQDDPVIVRGRENTETGVASGTQFSVHRFRMRDGTGNVQVSIHFQLSGVVSANFVSLVDSNQAVLGEAYQYVAQVAGTGDVNGTPVLLTGTVNGKGRYVEVVP